MSGGLADGNRRVRPEQLLLRVVDDSRKLSLDVAARHFLEEEARAPAHERNDPRGQEGDLALSMLAVDAILLAEPLVESLRERRQVRGRSSRLELDEKQVARLRASVDAHIGSRAEVER